MKFKIPPRFQPAYNRIKQLQKNDRYVGAFIFGSFARGDTTNMSDFDIKVIVNQDNYCNNINHPIINGVKLDITFTSINQLRKYTEEEIKKAERIPMIAESIIIFDKNGELKKIKSEAKNAKPAKYSKSDFQLVQFMIYHADDKAKRYLSEDESAALVAMEINLNDVLKYHYKLKGQWWVSNKRLMKDLRVWDKELAVLVEDFVKENNVSKKYDIWIKIIDYIAKPMGGRQPISENNCNCETCQKDLAFLIA